MLILESGPPRKSQAGSEQLQQIWPQALSGTRKECSWPLGPSTARQVNPWESGLPLSPTTSPVPGLPAFWGGWQVPELSLLLPH